MYQSTSVVAAIAALLIFGAAIAQAESDACLPLDRSNHLIGIQVQDPKGLPLGWLDDIVLRPNENTISYGVLAQGFVPGFGTKYVAVPWKAFSLKFDRTALVLDIPSDLVTEAAGFDRSRWPEGPDVTLLCFVGEQIPQDVTGSTLSRDIWSRRLSQARHIAVRGEDGRDIGMLNDYVIDLKGGHVVYGIVLYGGFLVFGQKMAPVPYPVMRIDAEEHVARVYGGRKDLDALAFRDYSYPDFGNREYAMKIYGQFHQEPYWETFGYVPPAGAAATKSEKAAPKFEKPAPEVIQTPTEESPLYRFPDFEPSMLPPSYLGEETPALIPEEDMWLQPGISPSSEDQKYILKPMETDPVNGPVP